MSEQKVHNDHSGISRPLVLLIAMGFLFVLSILALVLGYEVMTPDKMLAAIFQYDSGNASNVVFAQVRVPRLIAACLAGASLGVAGALIQALTRNPLADPGLLGVNAGASLGVVLSILLLGMTHPAQYVWTALAFSGFFSLIVLLIGGTNASNHTRLLIVGAAVMALCLAIIRALLLLSRQTLDTYRFWVLGGFDGVQFDMISALLPFFAVGLLLAFIASIWLNALVLGVDAAKGLGVRVPLLQLVTAAAIVLLCGATVALAGPISFVGLLAALVARHFVGMEMKWMLITSALVGMVLLILADILGRSVFLGGNIQAGVMSAIIGGPLLIWLIRRKGIFQS